MAVTLGAPSFDIVAIPKQDEYVWKISSEKVPHMTMLHLGDRLDNLERVLEYVAHAVDTSLCRFMLDVDHRGVLGDKSADVLFFSKYGIDKLDDFRGYLLQQPDIFNAYNAAEQFPQWLPHLTLGYPETPANPDERDYPGIGWISFDRLALWTTNFDGPSFELTDHNAVDDDLRMAYIGEKFLSHHGIKGMKWGIRRSNPSESSGPTEVTTHAKPGGSVKTSGGKNHSPHDDAVTAAVARQKARKSSLDSLSNKELQSLVTRMNLEQQYSRLVAADPRSVSKGQKFLKTALVAGKTTNDVVAFVNSPAGKLVKTALKAQLGR